MNEMRDKVCIVTGSNSGIGRETASALAKMGATIVMAVRNRERGEKARSQIVAETGNRTVDLMICSVSSKDSTRQFTNKLKAKYDRLHVLINNAGAFVSGRQITPDGHERTLAVNYLGPFLLTYELLPLLKSSAPSRIVNVGSGTHSSDRIDLDDLECARNYNGMKAYVNSKLMTTTFTYELAGRLEGTGVTANVVEPGFVATNLGRNSGSALIALAFALMRPFQISAKRGAENSVYLASAPELERVTGKCFSKMRERWTSRLSYDQQIQKRLWDTTWNCSAGRLQVRDI